jgi:uncharacterized protein (TIGR03437 family)
MSLKYNRWAVAVCLLLATKVFGQGTISTLAGRDWVFPGTNRPAIDAPLGDWLGIAPSPDGGFYVNDVANRMVFHVDASGTLRVIAGTGKSGASPDGTLAAEANLNNVQGIAIDETGRLLFGDDWRIRYLDNDQRLRTRFDFNKSAPELISRGATNTGYLLPGRNGVLYSHSNNLIFQLDANDRVTVLAGGGDIPNAPDGALATSLKSTSLSHFDFDSAGRLVFADMDACLLRRVNADGRLETLAGRPNCDRSVDGVPARGSSISPSGAGVRRGPDGLIYFVDSGLIRRISPAGTLETYAGPREAGINPIIETAFHAVGAMAFGPDGRLWIEDLNTQRIYSLHPSSGKRHQAGNGCFMPPSPRPGPGQALYLNRPMVSLLGEGELIVTSVDPRSTFRIGPSGLAQLQYGQTARNCRAYGSVPEIPQAWPGAAYFQRDRAGRLYYMDINGVSLFRLESNGTTRIVAGERPGPANAGVSFAGDGGPAPSAIMRAASQFWIADNDEIWIADQLNHRVRRVDRQGVMTTVAGTGQRGYSGDGGPAREATFNDPLSVTGDAQGNVYVADAMNHVIRKIDVNGIVSTIAGTGTGGFSGDGGPARSAHLNKPVGLWFDRPTGSLYVAEDWGERVRRIDPNGTISTVAGNGMLGYSGDGGPATEASLNHPSSIAVDAAGILYIGDADNRRVRRVVPGGLLLPGTNCSVTLTLSAADFRASGSTGRVRALASGECAFTTESTVGWLEITAGAEAGGGREIVFRVAPNPARTARTGALRIGPQTFVVRQAGSPGLAVEPTFLSVAVTNGQAASKRVLRITLPSGTPPLNVLLANTTDREDWLSIRNAAGTVSGSTPFETVVEFRTQGLAPGTYPGSIAVFSPDTGDEVQLPVTLSVSSRSQILQLSQTGLAFRGGASPQQVHVANAGAGTMAWSATASTTTGVNWLSITPNSGSSTAGQAAPAFTVTPQPGSLGPGTYYGTVEVRAPGAANPVQAITVMMAIAPPADTLRPMAEPASVLFVGSPGAVELPPQSVVLRNPGSAPLNFSVDASFPADSAWFTPSVTSGSIPGGQSRTIELRAASTGRAAGLYSGTLLLRADGQPEPIRVAATMSLASNCVPSRLLASPQLPGSGFNALQGWPVPVSVRLVNNCGGAVTDADVQLVGPQGTVSTPLRHAGAGMWSGTWTAPPLAAGPITLRVTASIAGTGLSGEGTIAGSMLSVAGPPWIAPGGILNSASYLSRAPVAPGGIVSIFGSGFGDSVWQATAVPLPLEGNGVSAWIGGVRMPLFFVGPNQINAQVPFEIGPDAEYAVTVKVGAALTVPEPVWIARAAPAVFTVDGSGRGQGHAYRYASDGSAALATLATGANPGDVVVLYATGLGLTNPVAPTGAAGSASGLQNPILVSVAGRPASILYAGLAPGFVGLYQINFTMPAGLPAGVELPVDIEVAGVRAPSTHLSTAR